MVLSCSFEYPELTQYVNGLRATWARIFFTFFFFSMFSIFLSCIWWLFEDPSLMSCQSGDTFVFHVQTIHSLIRGVLIQSCSAGAKNFTNYLFCHPQFSDVIQNIENRCAILILFVYVDYYQNNQFYIVKIEFLKFCFIGTMIFGTLAWTIELYMTK